MSRPGEDWIAAHEHHKDLLRAAEHQRLVCITLESQIGHRRSADYKPWRPVRAFTQLLTNFWGRKSLTNDNRQKGQSDVEQSMDAA